MLWWYNHESSDLDKCFGNEANERLIANAFTKVSEMSVHEVTKLAPLPISPGCKSLFVQVSKHRNLWHLQRRAGRGGGLLVPGFIASQSFVLFLSMPPLASSEVQFMLTDKKIRPVHYGRWWEGEMVKWFKCPVMLKLFFFASSQDVFCVLKVSKGQIDCMSDVALYVCLKYWTVFAHSDICAPYLSPVHVGC